MKVRKDKRQHHVFISDELGIGGIFNQIREEFIKSSSNSISLVYYSDSCFVFKPEFEVFAKRYSSQFFVCYIPIDSMLSLIPIEPLEVLLNTNTLKQILFTISAGESIAFEVKKHLRFLGIEKGIRELFLI